MLCVPSSSLFPTNSSTAVDAIPCHTVLPSRPPSKMRSYDISFTVALAATCLTGLVSAQSRAASIDLVIPRSAVQQGMRSCPTAQSLHVNPRVCGQTGANISVGFTDSSSAGSNNDERFVATKNCVYGPDGSAESNCTNPGYVSYGSMYSVFQLSTCRPC